MSSSAHCMLACVNVSVRNIDFVTLYNIEINVRMIQVLCKG